MTIVCLFKVIQLPDFLYFILERFSGGTSVEAQTRAALFLGRDAVVSDVAHNGDKLV
ncbi:hypothetical protein [Spirosoma flavum]|uniref:Uncharacterized protein n=1 Tax=Spirosoma flavum TaxID=2048557 RepID=A0ABW6AQ46_9BACT